MTDLPREFLEFDAPDTRWWQFWAGKREFRRQVAALWREHLAEIEATTVALTTLEEKVTNAENAAYARLGELVGLIRAEFESLRAQVDRAVQDKDAAVAAGVESALSEDAAADTARLEGLIGELESVLPAEVPDVEVPQPGQPAELPDDAS